MPQEFQVLKCYSCQTFQVHQVKKALKWVCKLCGEKQSVLKVFGRGTGADCRRHVQKLNMLQGQVEDEHEAASGHHGDDPGCHGDAAHSKSKNFVVGGETEYQDAIQFSNSSGSTDYAIHRTTTFTKWSKYADRKNEDDDADDDNSVDDQMYTTDWKTYQAGKKNKTPRFPDPSWNPPKRKKTWSGSADVDCGLDDHTSTHSGWNDQTSSPGDSNTSGMFKKPFLPKLSPGKFGCAGAHVGRSSPESLSSGIHPETFGGRGEIHPETFGGGRGRIHPETFGGRGGIHPETFDGRGGIHTETFVGRGGTRPEIFVGRGGIHPETTDDQRPSDSESVGSGVFVTYGQRPYSGTCNVACPFNTVHHLLDSDDELLPNNVGKPEPGNGASSTGSSGVVVSRWSKFLQPTCSHTY